MASSIDNSLAPTYVEDLSKPAKLSEYDTVRLIDVSRETRDILSQQRQYLIDYEKIVRVLDEKLARIDRGL